MASAPKGDGPEYQAAAERWRVKSAPWVKGLAPGDRDLILEFLSAIDPDDYTIQPGEDIGTKSHSTVAAYSQNLRLIAKAADKPLGDLTAGELNQVFSDMDISKNTLSQRQATARVFYRYHDQLDVDPEVISIERAEQSPVQPRDLFTREDVDAIHDAIDNPRDRAAIDLMLYTGQRVRAILTLKVKDIDLDNGRFYLNTEQAGLKGAKGMRPLIVAEGACIEWMDYHEASDDPEAYFITKLPDAVKGDLHTPLHRSTIQRRVGQIAEKAGIDRLEERAHPHNFRHTFVRWAYVNKGMDIPTIKYMTGHSKDSQTLEKTYMNIFEADFARKAEEAAGTGEREEPEDHLTPEVCRVCKYAPLPKDARVCPRCTRPVDPELAMEQLNVQDALATLVEHAETPEKRAALGEMFGISQNNPEEFDPEN